MHNQEKPISEEIKEIIKKLESPNIAVIGRTGTGKSTLINKIFGIEYAKTGSGLPITQDFCRFPPEGADGVYPIVIYDSPGYEAAKELEWVEKVFNFLKEKSEKDLKEQIHLIWYVINASSARVEFFEKDILNKITQNHAKAIIVLSQCDRARQHEIKDIEKALDSFKLENNPTRIKTSADPLQFDGKPVCEPFGLIELVDSTVNLLPEMYSESVIRAQITDLKIKRNLALKYVTAAVSACFGAAFIPIPGTTALTAVASQSALCIQIASIYGYKEQGEFIVAISSFTTGGLTNILVTTVIDLLSTFFPPIATYSATVSASFILAIGATYIAVFERLAKANITEKEVIEEFLKSEFRNQFKKYASINVNSPKALEVVSKTLFDE